jgi:tetratricopeptide (TPR) repeat protein
VKASAAIAGAAESVIPVPIGNKQVLAADFATQLARTGQIRRAREVVKHMQQLATEPAPVVALQRADLQVQAWAMQALVDGPARKAIDQLIADSARIPDSAERAKALAQAGVVLSQHALLPPAAARALLTLAGESLKSVPDARQRTVAMGEWMVATGQVALSEATALAKAGRLSKALAVSEQLNALVKEAPDLASKARLHALQYPMNVRTGQSDKANKSLETSATLVGNMTDLGEQAALLRAVAQLAGGMALPPVQSAATALRSHIDAKPGLNTEQAYVQLSLAYAESGLRSKADEYSRLAQTRKGLTPMESSILVSELIVRSDLAAAQSLHNAGQYQEAEAVLQRVRGYLF